MRASVYSFLTTQNRQWLVGHYPFPHPPAGPQDINVRMSERKATVPNLYFSSFVVRFVIISDSNVAPLYASTLQKSFKSLNSGLRVMLKVLPPGEHTKSRACKAEVEDW